jgi:hypothetical protein
MSNCPVQVAETARSLLAIALAAAQGRKGRCTRNYDGRGNELLCLVHSVSKNYDKQYRRHFELVTI